MRNNLLSWQWQGYSTAHRDRRNLLLHLVTAPIFAAGFAMSLAAPLLGGWLALWGLVAMVAVLVVQGRGHRDEATAPVPFTGPADFVTRFVAEQLITFPRFVLGGGFRRAWRAAAATTTV